MNTTTTSKINTINALLANAKSVRESSKAVFAVKMALSTILMSAESAAKDLASADAAVASALDTGDYMTVARYAATAHAASVVVDTSIAAIKAMIEMMLDI